MGVGIDVCIIVEHRYLVNKVVHKDATGDNHGISSRETNIQTFLQAQSGKRVPVGS